MCLLLFLVDLFQTIVSSITYLAFVIFTKKNKQAKINKINKILLYPERLNRNTSLWQRQEAIYQIFFLSIKQSCSLKMNTKAKTILPSSLEVMGDHKINISQ